MSLLAVWVYNLAMGFSESRVPQKNEVDKRKMFPKPLLPVGVQLGKLRPPASWGSYAPWTTPASWSSRSRCVWGEVPGTRFLVHKLGFENLRSFETTVFGFCRVLRGTKNQGMPRGKQYHYGIGFVVLWCFVSKEWHPHVQPNAWWSGKEQSYPGDPAPSVPKTKTRIGRPYGTTLLQQTLVRGCSLGIWRAAKAGLWGNGRSLFLQKWWV